MSVDLEHIRARYTEVQELLTKNPSPQNIDLGKKVLADIRGAGAYIADIPQRELYSQMARDLSELIFSQSGEYLPIRLVVTDTNIGLQNYYTTSVSARSPQEQRNRRAMLTKVRKIWIDGLLNHSLADELRTSLNLSDRPDTVYLPLDAVVQELEQVPRVMEPGVPISNVFDQAGGELLILGAPGSGKTTLILELLRDLLQRAERDEAHPIPIVFPLSTWAVERKPFKEWLVDQLSVIYDVPKKIGQRWVSENEVMPLLDGLDEVTAQHRDACVEAINRYRQQVGGLVPTAVASRIADYEALKGRLRLRAAVLVEPLTRQQVENYLARVGKPLRALRELVESDQEVMELLDSPLMLSVVSLAFQDVSPESLRAEGSVEERKARLWEAYIERMFTRKARTTKYSRQQTEKWLSWLARALSVRHRTIFFVEELQPYHISSLQRRYYSVIVCLTISIFIGCVLGIGGVLMLGISNGLIFGMLAAIAGGLGIAIQIDDKIETVEDLRWFGIGTTKTFISTLQASWGWLLLIVLTSGLAGGLLYGLFNGLVSGILSGLAGSLIIGLGSGLRYSEAASRTSPNEGIYRSLINSLKVGLLSSLIGLSVGVITNVVIRGMGFEVVVAVMGALLGFLIGMLRYGGNSIVQHYVLRYILYREGSLPFADLVPWLDYCSERLFIRRVGGGYIFIHRMLMEYFTAKYQEKSVLHSGRVK